MKLTDMSITAAERKEMSQPTLASGDGPKYPYGLELRLDHDALDKLGLTPPKVGATLQLIALVDVTGVSSYETQDQEEQASVTLQITDMSLETPKKGADLADRLYGKKG